MTIICWNVRGWGKEGRRADVFDLIQTEKVDLCGLVETKVLEANKRFIKRSLPKRWEWIGNAVEGQRHRIVVGWNQDRWKATPLIIDHQVICLKCFNIRLNTEIIFSFVYGHNREMDRCLLWNILETTSSAINSLNVPWVVLGDFNTVRSSNEKVGGNRVNMAWLERFNNSISNAGLSELKTEGARLTWSNRQRGFGRILGRIDRTQPKRKDNA